MTLFILEFLIKAFMFTVLLKIETKPIWRQPRSVSYIFSKRSFCAQDTSKLILSLHKHKFLPLKSIFLFEKSFPLQGAQWSQAENTGPSKLKSRKKAKGSSVTYFSCKWHSTFVAVKGGKPTPSKAGPSVIIIAHSMMRCSNCSEI